MLSFEFQIKSSLKSKKKKKEKKRQIQENGVVYAVNQMVVATLNTSICNINL